MCGICGAFQLTGDPREVLAPTVLDRMTDAMTHRGPDERGTLRRPGVAFGVRRLSIVDVAEGHQPVGNENGSVWAIQNGELYNHPAVRSDLRSAGHVLRTRCDTEIIPHLYEEHGVAFAQHLRGMFGIGVWDERRRRGVLTRDRMGIKPLYYAVAGDLLLFASELKSLLASGLVADDLDHDAIDAYLTLGYFPAPLTPLASVRKLLPGHRLVVEDGGFHVASYWSYPEPVGRGAPGDEEALAGALLEELDEAVRLRLMADVPLGLMLSGGLDSSLVLALMARHSSEPVKTFSVGFAGGTNELADARIVASHFGTDHHELELGVGETLGVEELVWVLDEPIADVSTLGFLALSELAARDVTVALSGQGADELLGGYRKHRAASLVAAWQRLPGGLRRAPEELAVRAPGRMRRAGATVAARDPVTRLLAMSGMLGDPVARRLLTGPLVGSSGRPARDVVSERLNGYRGGPLETTLYLDAQLALPDLMLHYFDRGSMAHSLEVRVPFIDHHVVELCARIPPELKVRGGTRKYLLRLIAEPLVPSRALHKPKIGFFHSAVDEWFRGQFETSIREHLLTGNPAFSEFLDVERVRELVTRGGHRRLLLAILMLEVWLSTFRPRAFPSSTAGG